MSSQENHILDMYTQRRLDAPAEVATSSNKVPPTNPRRVSKREAKGKQREIINEATRMFQQAESSQQILLQSIPTNPQYYPQQTYSSIPPTMSTSTNPSNHQQYIPEQRQSHVQGTPEPIPIVVPQDNDMNIDENQATRSRSKAIKKSRAKPLPLDIDYDIVQDVFKQKANIEIGDLVTAAPALRRNLIKACRPKRRTPQLIIPSSQDNTRNQNGNKPPVLAFLEDGDIDTTAVYAEFRINDEKIKTLIDCGAAKTCMSAELAAKLNLDIDAKSDSVFLMGNGTKQPALGLIFDVPINAGGVIKIPGSVEVLPRTPTQLIIGNNWLNRAKAITFIRNTPLKTIKEPTKTYLTEITEEESTEGSYTDNTDEPVSDDDYSTVSPSEDSYLFDTESDLSETDDEHEIQTDLFS